MNISNEPDLEREKDIDIEIRKQNKEQKRKDIQLYEIEKKQAQKSIRKQRKIENRVYGILAAYFQSILVPNGVQ